MTRQRSLLALIAITVFISGCATTHRTPIYMIEKRDIVSMPKGKPYTPELDGWFMSDFYVSEVMQAKVDKIKREN